ncbi:hypothetical protein EN742_03780 [Mesorhizobium sp. M4A.F.Ca.ET.020.02.1.1]|nr:hypothetical protein EN745_00830 [Mesorhizobium sp. M4A.F.Ca.ET.022.05.2.1]RVD43886.1 hypothetical protein EN742_03780 [Mesorhizobium sp. M4A.F.Ca.ET.020.02.1.1]RWC21819.1 MAG: hypothetical protein EOS53_04155 [Mesorhizobium sp.]RWD16039.1 MAG: hypothetical protein EOS74_10485 [Mesorhizobium sp.]RWD58203.1 MAG: hypothetical protein EOS75_00125 [Mesorhizobium sp.]
MTSKPPDATLQVHTSRSKFVPGAHLLEFIAIGTGVVHSDGCKGFRAHYRGRSPTIVVPRQLHL